MSGSVKKTLGSLKFTIFLIGSLAALFLLGLLIPQKELLGKEPYLAWKGAHPTLVAVLDFFQLTGVYTSYLIMALWGLFFLNLLLVMAERIPLIWRRCREAGLPADVDRLKSSRHYRLLEGKGLGELESVLKRAGYAVISGANSLAAVKNRFSPLGTILFHLSFILLLVGGATTFYTRFRAEADVAVGETFAGGYTKILMRPKIGAVPHTTFTVAEVKPTYFDRNVTVDLKVALDTRSGRKVYGINRPYRDGALSFIISDIDVAPFFVVQDRDGKEIDSAVVKLKVLKGEEDSFKLAGYTFKALFHTDYLTERRGGARDKTGLPQALKQFPEAAGRTQDREIVNPAFSIAVYRRNAPIASGIIRPGESLSFEGVSLSFADLGYWVHFYAGFERGLMIVYAGFVLMTVALVMRLFFYRREIRAVAEWGELHVAGHGEYFPTLFDDELDKILGKLQTGQDAQKGKISHNN